MGGTNGRTDGRTDGQTDERKSPCVLQDFIPFGAAAQKVYKTLVFPSFNIIITNGLKDGGTNGLMDRQTKPPLDLSVCNQKKTVD